MSGFKLTEEDAAKVDKARIEIEDDNGKRGSMELDIQALLKQPEHMLMANELGEFVEKYDRAHEVHSGKRHATKRSEMFIAMLVSLCRLGGMNSVIEPEKSAIGEIAMIAWKQGNSQSDDVRPRGEKVSELLEKILERGKDKPNE